MPDRLPDPWRPEHHYLLAIRDQLDQQNKLLTQILDRLPKPVAVNYAATVQASGSVELREPEPPASTSVPSEVVVEEPAPAKTAVRRQRKPRAKPAPE